MDTVYHKELPNKSFAKENSLTLVKFAEYIRTGSAGV